METSKIIQNSFILMFKNFKKLLLFYATIIVVSIFLFPFARIIAVDIFNDALSAFSIAVWFTTLIIGFGYWNFFLKLVRNQKPNIKDVFAMPHLFMNYFSLRVDKEAKGFFKPELLVKYLYIFAFYIMIDNPSFTNEEILEYNKELTNGYKTTLWKIDMGIGYMIVCFFLIAIFFKLYLLIIVPLILMPYHRIVLAYCYNELLNIKKEN